MRNITLVCSGHGENGLCNADELLRILRAIGPEVIFQEARAPDFDFLYARGSVEAHAITRYREFKQFLCVPVDRYDIPASHLAYMKTQIDYLFAYVEKSSAEYRALHEENAKCVGARGFSYLNSETFSATSTRLSEIEDETIKGSGNAELIAILDGWRQLTHRREVEMVRGVYGHCRDNVFETGVFLVGAAHRKAIVKQVERYSSAKADLIEWNFAFGGRVP